MLTLVVVITGFFSYSQTSKAASLMDDFKGFIPKTADVTRNGKKVQIPAQDVACGDLIKVAAG